MNVHSEWGYMDQAVNVKMELIQQDLYYSKLYYNDFYIY